MVRGDTVTRTTMEYIWVLDFNDGKVYRYDIGTTWNHGEWNPDSESCEDFLIAVGHSITNCEWMVSKTKNVNYIINK